MPGTVGKIIYFLSHHPTHRKRSGVSELVKALKKMGICGLHENARKKRRVLGKAKGPSSCLESRLVSLNFHSAAELENGCQMLSVLSHNHYINSLFKLDRRDTLLKIYK